MGPSGPAQGPALGAAGRRDEEAGGRPRRGRAQLPDRRHRSDVERDRARLSQRWPAVIFVDSNIPMYMVGKDHPHKATARHLIETALGAGERLVTDAEVLQEILHRYV